jgi:hypothetical protein
LKFLMLYLPFWSETNHRMHELSVRKDDAWHLGYIIIMSELQKLFSVKIIERIVTFGKVERIWEELVDACFRMLSWHILEGTEWNHREHQSG